MRQSRNQHRPPVEVLNCRCSPDYLAKKRTGQRAEIRDEANGLFYKAADSWRLTPFLLSAVCILICLQPAQAADPTLTVGSASGTAGSAVTLPVSFDPGTASVAGIQFNLILPSALSAGTVSTGTIVTDAGKSVTTNVNGNTWTFIIFGLNLNSIASGTLLTAQMNIAPGTPSGNLPIPVTSAVFTDATGSIIPTGSVTDGTVTVSASPSSQGSGSLWSPRVYPSPWRSDLNGTIPITFDQLTGNSTIKIFTVSGHLVRELSTDSGSTTWDLANNSGSKVASGLYFYVIKNDQGQKSSGKFVIIK